MAGSAVLTKIFLYSFGGKDDIQRFGIALIACSDRRLNYGDVLTQFGYGLTENNTLGNLRKLKTTVGDCGELIPMQDTICDSDQFRKHCQGDSGSGKMVFDRRGAASVAVVVSGSTERCPSVVEQQYKEPYKVKPTFNTDVRSHLHWICAATGICANEEIEESVNEYERLGLTEGWFKTFGPWEDAHPHLIYV